MNTKEVLLKAAEIVQERGLYKGDYAKEIGGPVCALGAVREASTGNPFSYDEEAGAACAWVEKFLPKQYSRLDDWNDKPRRRKHEVVALLRKAADSL